MFVVLATKFLGNLLCGSTSSEVWKHLYGALQEGTKPQKKAVLVIRTQNLSPSWHGPGPHLLYRKARGNISGVIKCVSHIESTTFFSYLELLIIIPCLYFYCVLFFHTIQEATY